MILVYIAGPFSADTREGVEANILRAVDVGLDVARLGLCPVIPHANTAHPAFEKLQPYTFWIDATLELCRRCDAMMMVPGWEHSSGANKERLDMVYRGRPVFEQLRELKIWASGNPAPFVELSTETLARVFRSVEHEIIRSAPHAKDFVLGRVIERLASGETTIAELLR